MPQEAGAHVITVRNRFPFHRFVGPRLSTAAEPAECIWHIGHPPAPEDGTLKRTLALVLGLAAVLLFAPVARADFHGGKSPYRDAAPLGHASGMQPADGEHDGDGDDHDGDANDQGIPTTTAGIPDRTASTTTSPTTTTRMTAARPGTRTPEADRTTGTNPGPTRGPPPARQPNPCPRTRASGSGSCSS